MPARSPARVTSNCNNARGASHVTPVAMRVPPAEYLGLKLRVHELLRDVPLYDVSVVDLPGGGAGRTVADIRTLDSTGIDYLVTLTADHGGVDIPERSRDHATPDATRVDCEPQAPAGTVARAARKRQCAAPSEPKVSSTGSTYSGSPGSWSRT